MSDTSTTDWLEVSPADDDSWLNVTDANAGKVSLAFQNLVDACMRGTNRVMACDGSYLAYRPFNREFDKEVNPASRERFASFQADGHFKHIGTYDEVQIYELLEGSKFKHKSSYVIGNSYWGDIRQAAKAACDRSWSDYHDILGGMATALKGGQRDPAFAKQMWGDALNQVAIQIQKMGGPAEREVNEGFVGVRKARGISRGGTLATLDTSGLQKVEFTGKRK
jgi:hypothetical protein